MVDRRFFTNRGPFTVEQIASVSGTAVDSAVDRSKLLHDVAPLDRAGPEDVSFFDNAKYLDQFCHSKAGVCFVRAKYAPKAPAGMNLLVTEDPYRCYALVAQKFYPTYPVAPTQRIEQSWIHPKAQLAPDVCVAPGAVIEADAHIASGVFIGANTVIGAGVVIGEDTVIGPLCSITHSLIGERCIIHRGVHIGQDGFGFALGRDGHVKVPQLGRVVIGNEVEIGSGTTVDRGTGPDTTIGDGCKIDNLVQIGHNAQLGKGVVMVAQSGVSGSTRIGDGTIIAGQSGVAGHLKVGAGVKIAGKSGVMSDIPAGKSVGGFPSVPIVEWHRQTVALSKLAKSKRGSNE